MAGLFGGWIGRTCSRVERDGHSWFFTFEQAGGIRAACPWRITSARSIVVTNEDDEQKFGLPAPVNAAVLAMETLTAPISSVDLDESTADLNIVFGGEETLQFWNSSSGYEGWNATILSPKGKSIVIGMGGGGTGGYDLPAEDG